MAYIGKTPVIGNFVKLDAISVVNGQAAYTMQNGGVNFTSYDNVNQFLVSLNGILQSPTDSFTVSGSTLTFASNLSTGDVIDFVMVLGNTLDIGTPSDNTVSLAKLTATGTKDATTFLRGDNSFASVSSDYVKLASTSASNVSSVDVNGYFTADYDRYVIFLEGVYGSASGGLDVYMRFNTGSYTTQTTSYNTVLDGLEVNNASSSSNQQIGAWNTNKIIVGRVSDNTSYRSNSMITIYNPLQTSYYHSATALCQGWNGTTTFWGFNTAGVWQSTTAVTGLNFSIQSGNIYANNITLYGLKD